VNGFFAMGGYAAYVWSAFAITGLLMIGLFVQSRYSARRRDAELMALRERLREERPRPPRRPLRPRREAEVPEPHLEQGG
jgi:heme exporter protein D